jgi:hypothetical protein
MPVRGTESLIKSTLEPSVRCRTVAPHDAPEWGPNQLKKATSYAGFAEPFH